MIRSNDLVKQGEFYVLAPPKPEEPKPVAKAEAAPAPAATKTNGNGQKAAANGGRK